MPNPDADAVMLTAPGLMPVICGGVVGVVVPDGIVMVAGDIDALAGSALASPTVTGPDAGVDRLIGRGID